MVSKDFDLMSEKDVATLLQGFHYTEKFPFSSGVSRLRWVQLATVKGNRFAILRDHRSQLIMTSIRVNLERFAEVGTGQHNFASCDFLGSVEGCLFLLRPFPLHCL